MTRRTPGPGRRGRPPRSAAAPARSSHGRPARERSEVPYQRRPFQGWVGEADLVAMREVVPSATAPLTLATGESRSVTLATVLPMSWAAMVRADGAIVVGLQTPQRSGDLDRDLGQALEAALGYDSSAGVSGLPLPDAGTPSFRELVGEQPLEVTVHSGFDWWLQGAAENLDDEVASSMETANASVVPTARLRSVDAAYWCQIGERRHLRWALTEDEDSLLDAMTRLHSRRELGLGDGTKYVGAFRAQGILMPVWDLAPDMGAEDTEAPAAALRARLSDALALTEPLTSDERRVRAGVVARQVTLR